MSNDAQPSYELVHLMTAYASRYGYLLGGLEMVAEGHATADAVLEAFRKKYDQPSTGCGVPHVASNSSAEGRGRGVPQPDNGLATRGPA